MILKNTLAVVFGLLFLSFVAVQYNDPDPALWMVIYGLAALFCFLSAAGKMPLGVLWLAALSAVAGAIYMWPQHYEGISIGGGDIRNIEEARESLGLFLVAGTLTALALLDKFYAQRSQRMQQKQKAKWAGR
ncbi:MAG: transmembrane 220 family protein [Pontibacter sp.]|nr:transmembrane 220 family protein [Pontibacter sp.]